MTADPPLFRIRRYRYPSGFRWVIARWIKTGSFGFYLHLRRHDGSDVAYDTHGEALDDVRARLHRKAAA